MKMKHLLDFDFFFKILCKTICFRHDRDDNQVNNQPIDDENNIMLLDDSTCIMMLSCN